MKTLHIRKDKCVKHGLTDVYLLPGRGNYACIKCANELQSGIVKFVRGKPIIKLHKPIVVDIKDPDRGKNILIDMFKNLK